VVEMVPAVVVEIVPAAFVVEMVPTLVVEIVPVLEKAAVDTAKVKVAANRIDLPILIVVSW
jgi:hypothetical protein